ncbi:hypothetical protein GCM10010106_38050 [Thermopolyspora flexuosa]|mgnify:CR=1 FL=1|uniref:Uncharacterized protein n=1 Tax=Thermopolyspora flexuosa TaxID=103836 RepID=A0A543J1Z2_9ACTN|nr:hypothetical protein [Thermopolyspora flexuosa]TQM76847.1 hypothetical protein FHX40_3597 [Thermopolyspora flexuosa]GGM87179.1 hypothetical protein GCM10010106_38050 [Thermopolyspora flexuosa]
MRKFLAAAATAATAGIMAIGLAAAPAQASAATAQVSSTQKLKCFYTRVLLTDFHVLDSARSGIRDGLFTFKDLVAVKNGKVNASGDLKGAATMLTRKMHKRWFDRLDNAAPRSKKDGVIAPEDLRAYLRKYCK